MTLSTVDEDAAIGVKVFDRTSKLQALLSSVPEGIFSTVYIADDGPSNGKEKRKKQLYGNTYPFDLEVLDLEYDTGANYGRHRIVEVASEEFLLMLDADLRVPNNVTVLLKILEQRPDYGGVSGCLAEPPEKRITLMGADFGERGKTLLLSPYLHDKEIVFSNGYPLVEFDLIPNIGLFRRACLLDYSWDPEYDLLFDHEDFYLGHWKRTGWSFAVCPQVLFPHYPGGDDEYIDRRWRDQDEAKQYFLQKWGYNGFNPESYSWFYGGRPNSLPDRAKRVYFERGMRGLVKQAYLYLRRISGAEIGWLS